MGRSLLSLICIVFCVMSIDSYPYNPLGKQGQDKVKTEHRVGGKKVADMTTVEWMNAFANYEHITTFMSDLNVLSQQIFLGVYPFGWLTDQISLSTLLSDAQGIYDRISKVKGTEKENDVGWFRMINNTIFHIEQAISLQEEREKLNKVASNQLKKIRKFDPKQAHEAMKNSIKQYYNKQIEWGAAVGYEGYKEAAGPSPLISKLSQKYEQKGNDIRSRLIAPLQDAKQLTVNFFQRVTEFLQEKKGFPEAYLNENITAKKLTSDARFAIGESIIKATNLQRLEKSYTVINKHKGTIGELSSSIREAHAALEKAVLDTPDDMQSRSMLIGAHKAQLLLKSLEKAIERIQYSVNLQAYFIDLVLARKKNQHIAKETDDTKPYLFGAWQEELQYKEDEVEKALANLDELESIS